MNRALTLCIIDDIKAIVEGIGNHIPWEQYGIRVSGTAINGEDGLKLILQERPDILISDIRMPVLDGLQMLAQCSPHVSEMKVILLTGYNDFDYARQALRLGVYDYLTKPFRPKQLIQVVLRAKVELEQDRARRNRLDDLEGKVRESFPLLRQEYLKLLIRYKANENFAIQRWSFLQVGFEPSDLNLMVIEIDDFAQIVEPLPTGEAELILFTVQNVLEETVALFAPNIVFRDQIGRFVCIFRIDGNQDPVSIAEACCHNITTFTKHSVSIGMGLTAAGLSDLPQAYHQAMTAVAFHFYTAGNSVIKYGDFQLNAEIPFLASELEQRLLLCLISGNGEKVRAILYEIFDHIHEERLHLTPEYVSNTYLELSRKMVTAIKDKLTEEDFAPIELKLRSIVGGSKVLKDWQQAVLELGRSIAACFKARKTTEVEDLIHTAMQFVRTHLHENLAVSDCARHVHVSASHFASLFKKITGQTFVQFLTAERMKRAQELLLSGCVVQSAAEQLGYEDTKYFRELFKKHTGMTPSQFKELYSN